MDKVTDVMVTVMDESIANDECYECDGKNEKSSNNQNKVECESECNTIIEGAEKKKPRSDKFLKMPSYRAQKGSRTQTEQGVTNNHSAITVGDYVTISDCPAHWLWASPFTVRAIESDLVALDMVDELIKISRLEKCPK